MTTLAVGNRRLLKLADILDTADAEHRKRKEPTYDQGQFTHECDTPACALGHWAAAHPRRWRFNTGGTPELKFAFAKVAFDAAMDEFCLDRGEVLDLFNSSGCGNARTAKQAAKYIRNFVARREAT